LSGCQLGLRYNVFFIVESDYLIVYGLLSVTNNRIMEFIVFFQSNRFFSRNIAEFSMQTGKHLFYKLQ